MKLIITIPKDKYRYIQKLEQGNTDYATTRMLYHAVKHGKPYLEQEPKTGHWVEYTRVLIPEPINKWEQAWYCSECGYGNQDSDESAWLEWNYCPNCGAKMIEPQESEG